MSEVSFAHSVEPDGTITLDITVRRLRARWDELCHRFTIASVDETLPCKIDCDGYQARPRLIVKLYCNLNKMQAAALLGRRREESLRSGTPLIY